MPTLRFVVRDINTKKPIPSAFIDFEGRTALTNQSGEAQVIVPALTNQSGEAQVIVPAKSYTVRIVHSKYKAYAGPLTVSMDGTVMVDMLAMRARTHPSYRVLALLLGLSVLIASTVSYAVTSTTVTLSNSGNIRAVGVSVFWDVACTNPVTSVDWGLIDPGTAKYVAVYIKNDGNVPLTLSLQAVNWNPVNAAEYIGLSWNYSGQAVDPKQAVGVALSLSISPTIQGVATFSFDIVITGVG